MKIRSVILCGGAGTRLWPASRKNLPKQFIPFFQNKSLFELTIERVKLLDNQVKPIVVCNKQHSFYVKKILKKNNIDATIILEPIGKNTTAAIYIAAKSCSRDENLIIMPSDHLISNTKQFIDDIKNISLSTNFNNWITLGIKPTKPSEAYGYIKVIDSKFNKLSVVEKFEEKPSKTKAAQYINNNKYFWNSGIFLGKASMITNSIQTYSPTIANACDEAFSKKEVNQKSGEIHFLLDLFSKIPSKSIDFGVMELEKNIKFFPLNCDWSDVGSWDTISEINKNIPLSDNIISIDSENNYIKTDKRIIATIGIKDLIIIDDDNATLIMKKSESEKVKNIVNELINRDYIEAEEHSYENRPWGSFENLLISKFCKVKRIKVDPQKRLSLQYHNFRSEHWLVVSGVATVYLNGKIFTLGEGMSIDIPTKAKHYIHNDTYKDLTIIETQLGTYFGEDDIIRVDDPYDR
jgi:mannose-1-phosphate guanylyltransferase/mannose-6-phosphate isomerase